MAVCAEALGALWQAGSIFILEHVAQGELYDLVCHGAVRAAGVCLP